MKLNYLLLLLVITTSGLFSCHTVDEKLFEEDFVPDPTVVVRADLRGIVKDSDGNALSGVSLKIGNEITVSDVYGYFKFENKLITAGGALLEAKYSGFLTAQKLVTPQTEDNYLQIRLISLNTSSSFSAITGGIVSLNDGASVQFLSNSIIDANGNDYSETVNVSSYYLSPLNPFIGELMPGSLRGVKTNGSLSILATLGMIYVELTDNSGQPLEIKEDYKAIIKFPIPIDYQSTAPGIMPMWSFNDDTGFWEEEGQAISSDGFYEAQVNHFSWWNADWPYNPISLKGKFVYNNAAQTRTAIQNTALRVSLIDQPWNTSTVYTNNTGLFCTEIPQSNRVKIEVLNDCGEIVYDLEVGPFGSATDLGEVVIDYTILPLMEVSGNLVDCDFELITHGYAIIQFGTGYSITEVDENGFFSASIPRCNNSDSIKVRGFDKISFVESEIVSFYNNALDLYVGELNVCSESGKIFVLEMEGERYLLTTNIIDSTEITAEQNEVDNANWEIEIDLTLNGSNLPPNNHLTGSFKFQHQGVGEYENLPLSETSILETNGVLSLIFTQGDSPLILSKLKIIEFNPESIAQTDFSFKAEFEGSWEDNSGDIKVVKGYFKL